MTQLRTRIILAALVAALAAGVSAKSNADDSATQSASPSPATTPASNAQDARTLIRAWPQGSQAAAEAMIDRYGQPDDVTSAMLIWRDKAPFRKTVVLRDSVRHSFPVDHEDVLLQEINLKVPTDKVDDLVKFDGSLIIDRTKGTVASRCDKESHNILALNLAQEIATGKRGAESARRFFADTVARQMAGKSSEHTEKLLFSTESDSSDPDRNLLKNMSSGSDSSSQGADVPQQSTPEPYRRN